MEPGAIAFEDRRTAWNARARLRLQSSKGEAMPACVREHALASRWLPKTARAAVDGYWRAHPLRADRLARALARRSGAPSGWCWQIGPHGAAASFRTPPLPFRSADNRAGPGRCVVCGQPVFRFGWHAQLTSEAAPNQRAEWHACCVVAWRFWTAPANHRKLLSKVQRRTCALSGGRLLRSAEVDHRVPLFQVWREHRDRTWPELLAFWGLPNLQVVNSAAHHGKSSSEARSIRSRASADAGETSPPALA